MKFEETAANISLHGLGFIQVKLGANQRLHVWHPDLPRRECFAESQVHDHRFGFTSTVLRGCLVNHVHAALKLEVDGRQLESHDVYVHEGDRLPTGNRPWLPDGRVWLTTVSTQVVHERQSYSMLPGVFHSTEPMGMVATIMAKRPALVRGARTLVRMGTEPDVDFDRLQLSTREMWAVVRAVLETPS